MDMEKWYLAMRIFGIGFSSVFVILSLLVVSLMGVNALLRRMPAAKAEK
jgi:Na+-transporting methylmalonyl-CoA/oxaloacetate decarboxylase gamma subunit